MRDREDVNRDVNHDSGSTNGSTDDDARAAELDDGDRALIEKLRALPPEGEPPDWKKLEAAIRAEVSPLRMPPPWWRNWGWLLPIGALATTAAIAVTIQIRRGEGDSNGATATNEISMRDASVPTAINAEKRATDEAARSERAAAMWLDGEPAELDDVPAEALEALDPVDSLSPHDSLDFLDRHDWLGPHDPRTTDDASDDHMLGVLPASDYQWIDTLRDDEAARLETYLERKRS